MPLSLTDDNISFIAKYITIVFRDETIQFQLHIQRFTCAALYSLAQRQHDYDAEIAAETYNHHFALQTLLTTLADGTLSPSARFAMSSYVYSLPGASKRHPCLWWEYRASRFHSRIVNAIYPSLTHLINILACEKQNLMTKK